MDEAPDVLASAEGINGTLQVLPGRVRMRRKKARGFMNRRRAGDKEFLTHRISSIEWSKATSLLDGYIHFSLRGEPEGKRSRYGTSADENSIRFGKKHQRTFEEARTIIEREMEEADSRA
jgi:hypothetical protein